MMDVRTRPMARLNILNGEYARVEFELPRGRVTLGRADDNSFPLPDPSVSSHHCELAVSDFSVRVRDLGSTNGTFVDGEAVIDAEVRDGQTLTLGDVAMRLRLPEVEIRIPEPVRTEEPAPSHLPDGSAACLHHPGVAAVYQCLQCSRHWCPDCARELHLVGGRARHFCPVCSGRCRSFAGEAGAAGRRKTRVHRVWDTIKLGFTWRTPGR